MSKVAIYYHGFNSVGIEIQARYVDFAVTALTLPTVITNY